jgi:hypothetical protein
MLLQAAYLLSRMRQASVGAALRGLSPFCPHFYPQGLGVSRLCTTHQALSALFCCISQQAVDAVHKCGSTAKMTTAAFATAVGTAFADNAFLLFTDFSPYGANIS